MRKLIVLSLLLGFLFFPPAQLVWGEAVDLANEEFEAAPGYDLGECGAAPCWTEVVGNPSSIDPDFAVGGLPGSPPGVWLDDCLEVDHASGKNGWAYYNINAETALTYSRIEFVIDDWGTLDDQESVQLAKAGDAEGQACWVLFLKNDGGTHKIYINFYNNGVYKGVVGHDTGVTEDTYYVVEVMYGVAATDGDARIHYTRGAPTDYGTVELDAAPDGAQYWYCGGDDTDAESYIVYYDEVGIDDSEWVGLGATSAAKRIIIVQ